MARANYVHKQRCQNSVIRKKIIVILTFNCELSIIHLPINREILLKEEKKIEKVTIPQHFPKISKQTYLNCHMKYDMPNFQTCGKSQKDVYTSKSPCLIYSDSSLIELEVLEVSEIPNKNVSGKH